VKLIQILMMMRGHYHAGRDICDNMRAVVNAPLKRACPLGHDEGIGGEQCWECPLNCGSNIYYLELS